LARRNNKPAHEELSSPKEPYQPSKYRSAAQPHQCADRSSLHLEVTHQFPGMASARGRKEKADQYVVGVALYLNRTSNPTQHIVVAGESLAKRPNRKIPRACQHFGVECCGLMEMLAREFPDEKW
jgi:hypothetical protein